jgi:glutathione S-transferase
MAFSAHFVTRALRYYRPSLHALVKTTTGFTTMPQGYRLIIGNKNYSSWSMRPWVTMTHAGIEFEETVVPVYRDDTAERLSEFAPAPARVPILIDGDLMVWDSLAILEYLNERHPDADVLPDEGAARALARSICAEMHSSFTALREFAPMNIRKRSKRELPDAVAADVARIESIWSECLAKSGGPCLFGSFGMADAFYAPVVMRFRSLEYEPAHGLGEYMRTIIDNAAVKAWCEAAEVEPWVIESSE